MLCMLSEHEGYSGLGMDALVIVCSRNTNVILVWAWSHYFWYAFGKRTLLWFGHGCACHRMPSEHERYHGLGMDALVIVCSRNTNDLMVWEWMHLLSYALRTRTLLWLGHGCAIVCSRNTNVIMVWAWSHYFWYAFGTRTLLWFGHGRTIFGMLSEHERYSGLGMVALFIVGSVIVCSQNTNIIMVWAWMRDSMLSEHERYYGVGMDALVIVCSQNTNVIMLWAWMLWHSRSLFLEKRDAWYTQYFGPPKHFESVVRATQATSREVGQVCIFCAFTLRRSQ